MTRSARLAMLVGLAGAAVVAAALAPPIPQDLEYHRMADQRGWLGIPNTVNVLSNLPFVVVGGLGLALLRGSAAAGTRVQFLDPRERWPYMVFFGGLLLTGFGSAYYHLAPENARLVWDRLPLAVTFMSLFAAVIMERIGVRVGLWLLGPLAALGVASVAQWHLSELRGAGDLRLYALVQFYPLLAIPVMVGLFPPRYTRAGDLLVAAALYGLAKLLELLDAPAFALGHVMSGHTLKHIVAAVCGYWVLRMLLMRRPA